MEAKQRQDEGGGGGEKEENEAVGERKQRRVGTTGQRLLSMVSTRSLPRFTAKLGNR